MFELTTKTESINEEKSFSGFPSSRGISFPEYLTSIGLSDLSAFAAIQLYMQAMPLFDAVDRRAQAFARIPIKIRDKTTGKFVDSHPALDLLAKPNADVSQVELLESISSFYDITGNSFIIATGNVDRPPLELVSESPVEFNFGALDTRFTLLNVPASIFMGGVAQGATGSFKPEETIDSDGIKFYNSRRDQELWHIRSFNPLRRGNFAGMSRARPIWYEIQQYIAGNRSNLSFLKRGSRLSMAWVNKTAGPEGELTPSQFERLQQEAQKYSGAENAGGTPILDGVEVQTFQSTNKDMEHKDMQNQMLARTFNQYRIPLALVLDSTMTLNNLETAMLHFFDDSVLPHSERMYGELTRFLMPRYKNSENLEFWYNENDIPALRTRMVAAAKEQNSIGVNTTDEIRNMLGDDPLPTGGDSVLVSATLIPLGTMIDDGTVNDDTAKEFFSIMRNRVNDKGDRVFSDEDIVSLALKEGLFDVEHHSQ